MNRYTRKNDKYFDDLWRRDDMRRVRGVRGWIERGDESLSLPSLSKEMATYEESGGNCVYRNEMEQKRRSRVDNHGFGSSTYCIPLKLYFVFFHPVQKTELVVFDFYRYQIPPVHVVTSIYFCVLIVLLIEWLRR